jgi:hypothetical protein
MPATQQQALGAYGLTLHPFVLDELRPHSAQDPETVLKMYTRVEGFKENKDRIDDWSEDAPFESKPVLAMVYGPAACGRSSVANYIYYKYLTNLEPDGFAGKHELVVSKVAGNHADIPVRDALRALKELITARNIPLGGSIREAIASRFQEIVTNDNNVAPAYEYGTLFREAQKLFANVRFSVLIDDVREAKQLTSALTAFRREEVPLIVFTTHQEEVLNTFVGSEATALNVRLRLLKQDDGSEFLERRWADLTDNPDAKHPFPASGVKYMFDLASDWPTKFYTRALWKTFQAQIKELTRSAQPVEPGAPALAIEYDLMQRSVKQVWDEVVKFSWKNSTYDTDG